MTMSHLCKQSKRKQPLSLPTASERCGPTPRCSMSKPIWPVLGVIYVVSILIVALQVKAGLDLGLVTFLAWVIVIIGAAAFVAWAIYQILGRGSGSGA